LQRSASLGAIMSARSFVPRPWPGVVVPALAAWLATTVTPAHAAETPAAESFNIRYYKTRDDGERANSYPYSSQDLTQYINRARCECGQDISTKIVLRRAMTSYDNAVRITTYVGSRCDQGQATAGIGQAKPCPRVLVSSASTYTLGFNFTFEPIWLADGVDPDGPKDIEDAIPAGNCDSGQGDGGVWICIEDGMITDCQASEFIIQGTQNENASDGMPQALHYDFSPPTVLPSSFSIQEGDGAIKVEWDQDATGDGNGFRVLCADADGNPLPEHGLDNPPALEAVSQGTHYFTAGNLCGGVPFPDAEVDLPDDLPTDESGGSDGTDDGTDTGGSTSTGDGGSTFIPVTDSGGSGSSGADELPSEGIESLDWDYVCTGHLSATARSARIEGLENDREYQFLVVAYDAAGNPAIASEILRASPRETLDLWEQCELQGEVCGEGGFCNCTAEPQQQEALGLVALAGVGLVGWARRRRRR
jgi:MYXO-CTERM domain-containing protein